MVSGIDDRALILGYERVLVERELVDFLDHVFIPDPPPLGKGSVAFIKWPHLMKLHEYAEGVGPGGVLPNLKARKLGVTSYFEARFTWMGMYHENAFLPVISQGEVEAKKVIADCRFIWDHLPEHLKVDLLIDNATTLKFKGGGTIEAFPATAKAGRSFTGTEILLDEADFHEEFASSYNALLPLIQDTGGKMFVVSTANPDNVDSEFRRVYQKSDNRLFLGYFDRPNRNDDSYRQARELASDDARFEKENPQSESEALAPPRVRAYFDYEALMAMQDDLEEPKEYLRGVISIWQKPIQNGRYVLGGDTAWGRTGSYNAVEVFDWQTGLQVAELHGRMHPDEIAQEIVNLHEMYNHAYMGLERAGEGQERDGESVVVVDKVDELLGGCSCSGRLYYHDNTSRVPIQPGWQTDGQSRPVMLEKFAEAVRYRSLVIKSRWLRDEMMTFIWSEKGRPERAKGAYDDRVMATAIACMMWNHAAYPKPFRGSSTRYPTFA